MPDAPEQIIINGQEYSPEDAQSLIDLGNKWKDTESSLNTSLDKVVPEYTRATQNLSRLEKELAERDAKIAEYTRSQEEKATKANTPEDADAIRANARKYGLVDDEVLKERGYLTKQEAEELFTQKQTQQQAADVLIKKCQQHESEIDGSDGRVPFDTDAVLAYMVGKNMNDEMEAYKQMNRRGNTKWEAAQIAAAERPGLTTLKGKGIKTPEPVKVTGDNFKDALNEALFGTRE